MKRRITSIFIVMALLLTMLPSLVASASQADVDAINAKLDTLATTYGAEIAPEVNAAKAWVSNPANAAKVDGKSTAVNAEIDKAIGRAGTATKISDLSPATRALIAADVRAAALLVGLTATFDVTTGAVEIRDGTTVIVSRNVNNNHIIIPALVGGGGTITSDVATAIAGATVTLTATPLTHFRRAGTPTVTAGTTAVAVTAGAVANTFTFTMPNSGVEVTAPGVFVRNTFNIVYNRNGGTGGANMANTAASSGIAVNLRNRTFTRTGFTFDGWATSATGPRVYTNGQSVTLTRSTNITLFARWVRVQYDVRFMDGTRRIGDIRKIGHGLKVTAPSASSRNKKGFTFVGWFTTRNGNTKFNFNTAITAKRDIHARYIQNPVRPAKFTAKRQGSRKARLTWTAQSGAVMEVRYRRRGTSKWTTKTTKAGAKNWTSPNLTRRSTFQFQVRARRSSGTTRVNSAWTATKTVAIR